MEPCTLLFSVKIMACVLLTPTYKGKTFTHIKADFTVLKLPFESLLWNCEFHSYEHVSDQ